MVLLGLYFGITEYRQPGHYPKSSRDMPERIGSAHIKMIAFPVHHKPEVMRRNSGGPDLGNIKRMIENQRFVGLTLYKKSQVAAKREGRNAIGKFPGFYPGSIRAGKVYFLPKGAFLCMGIKNIRHPQRRPGLIRTGRYKVHFLRHCHGTAELAIRSGAAVAGRASAQTRTN